MKAYILESGTTISPFFDPIGETPYLNVPLKNVQDNSLSQAGLEAILVPRRSVLTLSILVWL